MASDSEGPERRPLNGTSVDDHIASPIEPSTPQDTTAPPDSSQVTLPSTEIPPSPINPSSSFKTEMNDDRPSTTVIPSSLTPPPSTQVAAHNGNGNAHSHSLARGGYTQSQQSLFSPPATILNRRNRDRDPAAEFDPPTQQHVLDAGEEELRAMLQTCIAEQQSLKMEIAHHKLQYNLLSIQAEDESKRAVVEHDMMRREVDALRSAEYARQAKRELSSASEASHNKYLRLKGRYDDVAEENEALHHRLKLAKKVIQQKDEENMKLGEERDMALRRIRENREHMHMLCSPGGIFHGALTPKQQTLSTPVQMRATPRQTPRSTQRESQDDREGGLSALLQAMSQDNNNSAPSTPIMSHRSAARPAGKHRHVQSMSSLPTTPINRVRGEHGGLLPSADLVPQTEPSHRYSTRRFEPTTPTPRQERRRKSRESTISVEDNEELARQALGSSALQSFTSRASQRSNPRGHAHGDDGEEEEEVFDSQASQAATELLRRDPRESFEIASSAESRDGSPGAADKSARMQAKLANLRDKRKFSGGGHGEEQRTAQGSPAKRMRVAGGTLPESSRVGLGIQYSQ